MLIVSVLHICTHILYTSYEIEAFFWYTQQPVYMNLVQKAELFAQDSWLYAHIGFISELDMLQPVCSNIHTASDSITVATPVYQLTVSPSAAPKQHPRQDQVIDATGYLHM